MDKSSGIEIIRVLTDLIGRLALPTVLLIVIFSFKPTINDLLSRTTEADIGGANFKFAQQLSELIEKGQVDVAQQLLTDYKSNVADDILKDYVYTGPSNINLQDQENLQKWMNRNDIDTSTDLFIYSPDFKDDRQKAVEDLGLAGPGFTN